MGYHPFERETTLAQDLDADPDAAGHRAVGGDEHPRHRDVGGIANVRSGLSLLPEVDLEPAGAADGTTPGHWRIVA
jgi:hypothetical protein